jgi:hypothetical protein
MGREIQLREQRLAEWNKNLETTVAERTSALALGILCCGLFLVGLRWLV